MAKRHRSSGWDLKPSSSLPSPAGHNSERNRGQEKEDYHVSVRDRFEGFHSSGRHGWGPPPRDTNGCVIFSCVFACLWVMNSLCREGVLVQITGMSYCECTVQTTAPFILSNWVTEELRLDAGFILQVNFR